MEGMYLVVMLFFGSILITSWFFGELAEGAGEAIEGIGNVIEGVLEALPGVGDVELTGDIKWGKPGIFRSLILFGTFWGGGGYIALRWFHFSKAISVVCAFAFGTVGFLIGFLVLRFMARFETSAVSTPDSYIGLWGAVVLPINPGAFGSVAVNGKLGTETLTARAEEEIKSGEKVEIVSMEGGIATVRKI